MKTLFSLLAAVLLTLTASADTLPKMTLTPNGDISTTDWTADCAISYNGTNYSDVELQYTSSSKKTIRIKLNKKKALIGDQKYKQWVLLSNSDDATKMRNALANEVSKAVGMEYTPQYQFVDLYIGNTYAGIYQLTDRVKCETGRACAGDATGIEWLVQLSEEGDVTSADTYVTGTKTMPFIVMKNPDPDDFTDNQAKLNEHKKEMETYFTSFFDNPKDKVMIDQFVAWYIASEIMCNYKGFSEVFAYRSNYGTTAQQQLRFGPIWDNEKAFDNNASHAIDMSDLATSGSYEGMMIKYADHKLLRKWVKALMENTNDTWLRDAVWTKWQALTGLQATLVDKVSELETAIGKTAGSYSLSSADKTKLTTYLSDRFAYLDVKFAELTGHSSSGISSVVASEEGDNTVYSITGQRMSSAPLHGIYVKNGKKIMAR